ncbi:MAG: hypothetical protein RL141_375, partial [Candidatus Parcubacteria bacterium]
MIEIKLQEIADRLGKNITDIARETGLNRNTITSLYHNNVDGIKFSTIDILCETYGITLQDLVVRKEFRIGAAPATKITREIHTTTPLFSWLTLQALHQPSKQYFEKGVGNLYAFFIRNDAEWYFNRTDVNRFARNAYEQYGRDGLDEIYATFERARDQLIVSLKGLSTQPIEHYISADLIKAFQRLNDLYADML